MASGTHEVADPGGVREKAVFGGTDKARDEGAGRVLCSLSRTCSRDTSQLSGKWFEHGCHGVCSKESNRMGIEELIYTFVMLCEVKLF